MKYTQISEQHIARQCCEEYQTPMLDGTDTSMPRDRDFPMDSNRKILRAWKLSSTTSESESVKEKTKTPTVSSDTLSGALPDKPSIGTFIERARNTRRTALADKRIWYGFRSALRRRWRHRRNPRNLLKFALCRMPFIETVMAYEKGWIINDLLAGLALTFMQVAQGLAYGALAGLNGAIGLYTSIYPGLVYAFFGTSRHISIGTFAVLSLLVRKSTDDVYNKLPNIPPNLNSTQEMAIRSSIASSLSIASGLMMVAFSVFQVGSIVVYLTKPLIGGYLCAAGFFVFTSQVPSALGLKRGSASGFGIFFKNWYNILRSLRKSNWVAVLITISCVAFLCLGRFLNRKYKKFIRITLPLEVICITVMCSIGYSTSIFTRRNVSQIGVIPSGLTAPMVPSFSLFKYLGVNIATTAMVTMAVNFAIILRYAEEFHYSVSTSQDLFAYGMVDILSSFFSCFPACASLSRTTIAVANKQQTQLASVVSSFLLIIILFTLTGFLAVLPNAVLAAIVMFNIMGTVLKITDLPRYWQLCFVDGMVWLQSFVAVLFMDLDLGLVVALAGSFAVNTAVLQRPVIKRLGKTKSNAFIASTVHKEARELPKVAIFAMEGPLVAYNVNYFKQWIRNQLTIEKTAKNPGIGKIVNFLMKTKPTAEPEISLEIRVEVRKSLLDYIVFECSQMTYVDNSGADALHDILKDIQREMEATILMCGLSERVITTLDSEDCIDVVRLSHVFLNLAGAMEFIKSHKGQGQDTSADVDEEADEIEDGDDLGDDEGAEAKTAAMGEEKDKESTRTESEVNSPKTTAVVARALPANKGVVTGQARFAGLDIDDAGRDVIQVEADNSEVILDDKKFARKM